MLPDNSTAETTQPNTHRPTIAAPSSSADHGRALGDADPFEPGRRTHLTNRHVREGNDP